MQISTIKAEECVLDFSEQFFDAFQVYRVSDPTFRSLALKILKRDENAKQEVRRSDPISRCHILHVFSLRIRASKQLHIRLRGGNFGSLLITGEMLPVDLR